MFSCFQIAHVQQILRPRRRAAGYFLSKRWKARSELRTQRQQKH